MEMIPGQPENAAAPEARSGMEPRALDDLSVRTLPSDRGTPQEATPDAPPDPQAPTPEQREQDWDTFTQELLGYLETETDRMDKARERLNFSKRMQVASDRTKARASTIPVGDLSGSAGAEDPDRRLNLSLGLSLQATLSLVAAFGEYLLETAEHPNELTLREESDEAADAEESIQMILDDQHDGALFLNHLQQLLFETARYPLGVWRWTWQDELVMTPSPEGGFRERIRRRGIKLETWPLERVWFSDYDKPLESQSRLVVWYSERNFEELAAQERVEETVESGGETSTVRRGRFINMEKIRRQQLRAGTERSAAGRTRGGRFKWPSFNRETLDEASTALAWGVVEAEGYLPMATWVNNGKFKPHMLREAGIDPGPWRDLPELGRRLSAIFMKVAVTTDGTLLQFEPCEFYEPMNSAIACPLVPGDGLMGFGVVDLIGEPEEAADRILNDETLNSMKRADPTKVYNRGALLGQGGMALTDEQLEAMDGIGERIYADGDVDKIYTEIAPEINPAWMNEMLGLKAICEDRSGMNAQFKGQSNANFAVEARQNLSQGAMVVSDRARSFGERVIEKLDRIILACFETYLTDEEWQQLQIEVAGRAGLRGNYVLESPRGLCRRFNIVHAGNPTTNREVRANLFAGLMTRYAQTGKLDLKESLLRELALLRERNPKRLVAEEAIDLAPEDELKLIAKGKPVRATEAQDHAAHIEAHMAQLEELQAGVSPEPLRRWRYDPEETIRRLGRHIEETEPLAQAQMMAQMQERMAASAAAEEPPIDVEATPAAAAGGAGEPSYKALEQGARRMPGGKAAPALA